MIGANDRQQMLVDGVARDGRSRKLEQGICRRAPASSAKAIAARKVPFLWVGMPPFKSSKMMLDMLAFNDIYREAAASAGGEFVDIWDGFVDENGAYMSTGPDINGQPVRLRAADGINLSKPGKRKVAFYAEKPLYKLLGIDPAAPAATARCDALALSHHGAVRAGGGQAASDIDIVVDPNELGPLDPARPVALRTPALDGGVELLGVGRRAAPRGAHAGGKTRHRRRRASAVAGRADQFAWPQLASAATAMRAMNIDRTTNKIAAPSVLPDPAEDTAEPRAGPLRRADRAAAPGAASRAAGDPAGPAGGGLAGRRPRPRSPPRRRRLVTPATHRQGDRA